MKQMFCKGRVGLSGVSAALVLAVLGNGPPGKPGAPAEGVLFLDRTIL
jgi:hypothetical protein